LNILAKNIFSNYIGKIWSFISIYLFIPQYVKILGIESYGIINFYTVLLSIMLIADSGLSASLSREMARSNDLNYKRNLLKTIEKLYYIISFIIFCVIFFSSQIIVDNWLNVGNNLNINSLYFSVKLMGGSIALQMMFIMYTSGLMGLQKQVKANNIQILLSIFRSGLVLIPLYYSPNIEIYFIWQLITTLLFTLIIRFNLWKVLKSNVKAVFSLDLLKNVYKFALGMLIMALIAGLNTQIDKLFVSKLLSIKDFGYYSLAGVIGQTATILILPIAVAILPKMTIYAEQKDIDKQIENYHKYSFIIATLVSILTGILIVFAKTYIFIWTKNIETTEAIVNVSRVLLLGGAFLALQYMPYHLAIAHGHTKTNIRLGVVMILIISPLLYFSIKLYGLIGATYAWLFINFVAFFYLGYFLTQRFLPNHFTKWFFKDTLLPIFISLTILISFAFLCPNYENWNILHNVLASIILSVIILSINSLFFYKKYLQKI